MRFFSRGGCDLGRGGVGVEGVGLPYHSPYRFMILLLLLFLEVAIVVALLVIAAAVAM